MARPLSPGSAQRAVDAELARLHQTLSFAAPSSHLYHDAQCAVARPPGGTRLAWGSTLRSVELPGVWDRKYAARTNALGAPLSERSWGASQRAVLARGALTAADVLAVRPDAEQAALAERLAARPADPEMAGTMARALRPRRAARRARARARRAVPGARAARGAPRSKQPILRPALPQTRL
jgi:hypothetical protein